MACNRLGDCYGQTSEEKIRQLERGTDEKDAHAAQLGICIRVSSGSVFKEGQDLFLSGRWWAHDGFSNREISRLESALILLHGEPSVAGYHTPQVPQSATYWASRTLLDTEMDEITLHIKVTIALNDGDGDHAERRPQSTECVSRISKTKGCLGPDNPQ